MNIINAFPSDLEDFKSGGKFNRISTVLDKIIEQLPDLLKTELRYRKIALDYYVEEIDNMPKFTIPYCFDTREYSEQLKEYFKYYIIFIEW